MFLSLTASDTTHTIAASDSPDGILNMTQVGFTLGDSDSIGLGWDSQEINILKTSPGLEIWKEVEGNSPKSYMVGIHTFL